ncbi:hypothetical protein BDK51DRAFT_40326 [Blyttiomyces helicus]|uniref:Uncharacterized protein n=1 Tax=Blyttiomyces helicus TaxID=388810 RepID=A0A4P9WRJ9_9FUNG|nr:hypothetical protein BDK51DRAFT_40326 [Blyttiomyces helicus]|eukprot:RKO93910.1 hypothetical protein BDK51DRAFT_40326 [Blyttiomyces helicus]
MISKCTCLDHLASGSLHIRSGYAPLLTFSASTRSTRTLLLTGLMSTSNSATLFDRLTTTIQPFTAKNHFGMFKKRIINYVKNHNCYWYIVKDPVDHIKPEPVLPANTSAAEKAAQKLTLAKRKATGVTKVNNADFFLANQRSIHIITSTLFYHVISRIKGLDSPLDLWHSLIPDYKGTFSDVLFLHEQSTSSASMTWAPNSTTWARSQQPTHKAECTSTPKHAMALTSEQSSFDTRPSPRGSPATWPAATSPPPTNTTRASTVAVTRPATATSVANAAIFAMSVANWKCHHIGRHEQDCHEKARVVQAQQVCTNFDINIDNSVNTLMIKGWYVHTRPAGKLRSVPVSSLLHALAMAIAPHAIAHPTA